MMSENFRDRKNHQYEEQVNHRENNMENHEENHDRWLVSYADFITLLFAFFVVMYATSNNNQDKQKAFEKSVRTNLKLTGDNSGSSGAQEGNVGGETAGETVILLDGFPPRGVPSETEQYIERVIDKKLDRSEKEKIQQLRHDALGVRIALASAHFFLPGGVKIRTSALSSLDKIAEILKETDKKIVIEGHTDNTPVVRNSLYESNWELASLRATSIVRYLTKYHNIDSKRISATSYADTRPLKDNNSAEGRSKNRRIEIYIILDEKLQD